MTTVILSLPDQQAEALKAKARAQGLTLEDWISKTLASDETQPARSPSEAAAHIRELQKHVRADPEGWSVREYVDFGRR